MYKKEYERERKESLSAYGGRGKEVVSNGWTETVFLNF
jgi:hypothetical protein